MRFFCTLLRSFALFCGLAFALFCRLPFTLFFGGSQKGGFQKEWFWRMFPRNGNRMRDIRMFPRNENRNEGTFAYPPGTTTETRAHSPKLPFYETGLLFPLDFCAHLRVSASNRVQNDRVWELQNETPTTTKLRLSSVTTSPQVLAFVEKGKSCTHKDHQTTTIAS